MNHFMLIMEGYGDPSAAGEAYFASRAPTASSLLLVSDAAGPAYRVAAAAVPAAMGRCIG